MSKKNNANFIAKLNGNQKFGLRKLSIGLTTVILGTTFLIFSNPVQAAENGNNQVAQTQESTEKNEIKPDLTVKDADQAPTYQDQKDIKNITKPQTVSDSQAAKNTSTSNDKGQAKQTTPFLIIIGPDQPQYLMADNNTGNIQVDFKGDKDSYLFKNGDSFSISVDNSDNFLKFSSKLPTFDGSMSNFHTSQSDSTYTFTYQGQTPFNLQEGSVTLSFLGNNDTVLNYNKDHNITDTKQFIAVNPTVTVTFPNQVAEKKQVQISLYPYANIVDRKEMVNGYPWQGKVIFTPENPNGFIENNVTYTGPEESAKADIPEKDQQAARLMQYIINWNYGRGIDNAEADPLNDVIAYLKFNDGQKILPHTIKVFKITDPSLIGSLNKNTNQIDRRALDNETYAKITASENEDTNFEKFLQDSINNNQSQISINQTGPFTVNGQDYSKNGAYFIQLDTLLDIKDNLNKWTKPSAGPSISYPQKNTSDITGSSDNNIKTQTYLGFNSASGTGSEITENILVKYVDDDADEKVLDSDSLKDGTPNTSSNYSTKNKITQFEKQGYLLVNDPSKGEVLYFDDDNDPDNQVYIVHLKHDHSQEIVSRTIHETIHYYYNDDQGNHTTKKVFDDYNAQVSFKQVQDKDLVTKKITTSKWTPDDKQDFVKMVSPKKPNYSVSLSEISKQTVTVGSSDLVFNVYYSPAHKQNTESKTVNETIHYYYKGTTSKVFDDHTEQIIFTRTKDTNLATGKVTYSNWTPETASFSEVKSPVKNGFTYDKAKVDAQKISPTDKDLAFIVYYVADPVIPTPTPLPTPIPEPKPEPNYPVPLPNNEPNQDQTTTSNEKQTQINKSKSNSASNQVVTQERLNSADYPKVHAANEIQQITPSHKNTQNELPQTSNKNLATSLISLAGLLVTGFGLFILNSKKKN